MPLWRITPSGRAPTGHAPTLASVCLVLTGLVGSGCVQRIAPGPDLGRCAEIPDGVYGYGEAGIGTCLAGPADLAFFQQDGETLLAITNADPFREFRTGSVLLLDWTELAAQLADSPPERIFMDEVAVAGSLEIFDDDDGDGKGDNPFLGGFGYLPDRRAAVVTSRLTEASTLRAGRDEAFVLDLDDPSDISLAQTLVLEDDPFPVVVEDPTQRVYIGNLTDHSVSVLSSREIASNPDQILTILDVAPGASAEASPIEDLDGSGSLAELSTLAVTDAVEIFEDRWTMTFVDGTVRLYVPTPVEGTPGGLSRYNSADGVQFSSTAFGPELGLGDGGVFGPFAEIDPELDVPVLWYARADGSIRRAIGDSSYAGEWLQFDEQPILVGGYASPSVAPLPTEVGLFAERHSESGVGEIVLSTSSDNASFGPPTPVLSPPLGQSYEDPFVVYDTRTYGYRMWLSVRTVGSDGLPIEDVSIALSESEDGRSWSEPLEVLTGETSVAAPALGLLDGRYLMWFARAPVDPEAADATWEHAVAWSYDGRVWSEPVAAIDSQMPFDPLDPPRAAVVAEPAGAWRIEGNDNGPLSALLPSGQEPLSLVGYDIAVSSGHVAPNATFPGRTAARGIVPGSVATVGSRTLLFVTAIAPGRERVGAMEDRNGTWIVAIDPLEMSEMLGLDPGQSASDPVVVADEQGYVMFVTVTDANGSTVRRSVSDDGLSWGPVSRSSIIGGDPTFDDVGQSAHSIELTEDGRYRLWFSGSDGSVWRIGSAVGASLREPFGRERGQNTDWRLGTGLPGSFDDSSVQHPMAFRIGEETHLYYAGFDGSRRHLGHAVVQKDGTIERRTDPSSGLSVPAMDGLGRTFSAAGVESPVLYTYPASPDGPWGVWYAGCDTLCTPGDGTRRLGRAVVWPDRPESAFATQRFPTAGDRLSFTTTRGGPGAQVIELEQATQEFDTQGWGMSSMTLDADRGFLYVTTKLDDTLFVLDVHDNTSSSFVDANALDVEALVQVDTGNALAGFRSMIIARQRGLGILTGRNPDQLVMIDLDRIPDDDRKDLVTTAAVAVHPLQSSNADAGADTLATFGGAGMALSGDERTLLVTHFRGNGVSVFDLDQGSWGSEIAWIPNIGENPHVVRISPDGRWAVVANYLGEVDDQTVSSTLAVIDLDPTSERYLEVVTWLANH